MTLGGMEDQLGVTWCEVNSLIGFASFVGSLHVWQQRTWFNGH